MGGRGERGGILEQGQQWCPGEVKGVGKEKITVEYTVGGDYTRTKSVPKTDSSIRRMRSDEVTEYEIIRRIKRIYQLKGKGDKIPDALKVLQDYPSDSKRRIFYLRLCNAHNLNPDDPLGELDTDPDQSSRSVSMSQSDDSGRSREESKSAEVLLRRMTSERVPRGPQKARTSQRRAIGGRDPPEERKVEPPVVTLATGTLADLIQSLRTAMTNGRDVSIPSEHTRELYKDLSTQGMVKPGKNAKDWLEMELEKLIGQESIKESLRRLQKSMVLNQKRRKEGFRVPDESASHMVFKGNPGTGKTSIARIIGKMLNRIGVLSKGHVVEVKRPDLVAGVIGQTAMKTQEKLREAEGGIFFVDEAYQLTQVKHSNDYGHEALETIMSVMEGGGQGMGVGDCVVIFAGYPAEIEQMLDSNQGLRRRVGAIFAFQDYTPLEIARIIFTKFVHTSDDFQLHEDTTIEKLEELVENKTTEHKRRRWNGGLAARIVENSKRALNSRLDPFLATGAELITVCERDIEEAFNNFHKQS